MSAFFLYHGLTRPTGRLIARTLGIPFGRASRVRRELSYGDVLIRWGSQERVPEYPITINHATALARASDKLAALRCFAEAEVPHPEFADRELPSEGVWLGRQRHGYGGRDIVVFVNNHSEGNDDPCVSDFYTKFIPNEREYRIHVYNGEVIRVQRKYLDFPEQRTSEYIKNYQNGYRFRAPRLNLRSERLDTAKRAVEALGLTFGAVDAVIGLEDDVLYVLEVNTAPKCSPLTARAYVRAMAEHLREVGVEVEPRWEVLDGLGQNE